MRIAVGVACVCVCVRACVWFELKENATETNLRKMRCET